MATTTIHLCDICKNSKGQTDLASLKIEVKGLKIKDCNLYSPLKVDICSDCLKKKGFVIEYHSDEEGKQAEAQNKVTLEDKIYEILSDMGVVFQN